MITKSLLPEYKHKHLGNHIAANVGVIQNISLFATIIKKNNRETLNIHSPGPILYDYCTGKKKKRTSEERGRKGIRISIQCKIPLTMQYTNTEYLIIVKLNFILTDQKPSHWAPGSAWELTALPSLCSCKCRTWMAFTMGRCSCHCHTGIASLCSP